MLFPALPIARSLRAFTILVIGCLSFASASLASGWGSPTTITGHYVYADGYAYIRVANAQNPDGCSSTAYLAIKTTTSNFKAIWAQILAAHAAGQTVAVLYEGCLGTYPIVGAIAVPNIW